MSEKIITGQLKGLRFGDKVENRWASVDNPHRFGYFVRYTGKKQSLAMCTDRKGEFWETGNDDRGRLRLVEKEDDRFAELEAENARLGKSYDNARDYHDKLETENIKLRGVVRKYIKELDNVNRLKDRHTILLAEEYPNKVEVDKADEDYQFALVGLFVLHGEIRQAAEQAEQEGGG